MLSSRMVGWSRQVDGAPTKDERRGMAEYMRRVAGLYPASELNMNLFGPSMGVLAPGPGARIQAALRLAEKDELTAVEQAEWNEAVFLVYGSRMRGF